MVNNLLRICELFGVHFAHGLEEGVVKFLIAGGKSDDATVVTVIQRLVAEKQVVIDAKGAVTIKPA